MTFSDVFDVLQGYQVDAEPAVAACAKNIANTATQRLVAAVKLDYRNSVHIGALSDLTRYLEHSGHSLDSFYRLSGLKPDAQMDPDRRIPIEAIKKCWKIALEMTRDPALALAVGANYSSSAHGILGHLIAHSETMGAALRAYCRYIILLSGGLQIEIKELRGEACVVLATEEPDPVVWPRVVERNFAAMLAVAKNEAIGNFSLDRIELDYPEPAYSSAYRKYFGVKGRFGAKAARLIFPRKHLDLRMRHQHSSLQSLLAREAESTYRKLVDENGATTATLWNTLPILLDRGLISAQAAADATRMSVRTLHRRLLAERTSFLELLDKARYERAIKLMEAPGVSIEEIAFACGFLDGSGFFRAFKRWTGMAPRAYRQSKRMTEKTEIAEA
jgi:AraC-like DNA-binding protein